jgi:hypothetical protein
VVLLATRSSMRMKERKGIETGGRGEEEVK